MGLEYLIQKIGIKGHVRVDTSNLGLYSNGLSGGFNDKVVHIWCGWASSRNIVGLTVNNIGLKISSFLE